MAISNAAAAPRGSRQGALFLGTGLALASLILIPALAGRLGLGSALTGALRIAFMRASSRVVSASSGSGETAPVCLSCH